MRRKKRKSGKIIFTILILAALCVSGAFVYEYFIAEEPQKPEKKPTETTEVEPEKEAESTTTPETKNPDETQIIGKDPIVQYEGENPNKSDSLTGVITYAGIVGQKLTIRLNIDQYLGAGNCNLSLMKDGTEYYSASANIIADASTSTCQGFDVETTNLPSGNYLITINLQSGDKTGTITGGVSL